MSINTSLSGWVKMLIFTFGPSLKFKKNTKIIYSFIKCAFKNSFNATRTRTCARARVHTHIHTKHNLDTDCYLIYSLNFILCIINCFCHLNERFLFVLVPSIVGMELDSSRGLQFSLIKVTEAAFIEVAITPRVKFFVSVPTSWNLRR